MGGNYSLHIAYRTHPQLAGAFVCAPFLNYDSAIYDSMSNRQYSSANLPKLICIHGDRDDVLLHEWGVFLFNELKRLGVRGDFHTIPGGKHEIRMGHLLKIEQWARELLSSLPERIMHKL